MKRLFLTSIISGFFVLLMYGSPAKRLWRTVKLYDGTQVSAVLHGDEEFSYYLTSEGRVVALCEEGYKIVSDSESEYVKSHAARRMQRNVARIGSPATAPLKSVGNVKVPVVLVSFSNSDFSIKEKDSLINYYHLFYNGIEGAERYTGHGSFGSVRDYFVDHSRGKFTPEFDIIGEVKLGKRYQYYGQNTSSYTDINFSRFISESLKEVSSTATDWSRYDNDGNGSVDLMLFVFSGLSENLGGEDSTIWAKFQQIVYQHEALKVSSVLAVSERGLTIRAEDEMAGVGTPIHEFCHALGMPDFYVINGDEFGMDCWSLMDYGNLVFDGTAPPVFTAYEREFLGWDKIEELHGPSTVRVKSFGQDGGAYKVVSDANPDEYYILENRQPYGWDNMLCSRFGHGLLVTHVDYDKSAWNSNRVNINPTHQRMTVIPANNSYKGIYQVSSLAELRESLQGNPYPGTSGNHELTDTSLPSSALYKGGYMGKPIMDIQEDADGMITFKFMPRGQLAEVGGLSVSEIKTDGAKLSWDGVGNAQAYNLKVMMDGEAVLSQDSIYATEVTLDGLETHTYTFSVQAIADEYLNGEWSGAQTFDLNTDGVSTALSDDQPVRVYSLNGVFLLQTSKAAFPHQSLPKGTYILKYADGKAEKTILP